MIILNNIFLSDWLESVKLHTIECVKRTDSRKKLCHTVLVDASQLTTDILADNRTCWLRSASNVPPLSAYRELINCELLRMILWPPLIEPESYRIDTSVEQFAGNLFIIYRINLMQWQVTLPSIDSNCLLSWVHSFYNVR